MTRNEMIAQALDRLFRTYPQSGTSLEDRVERAAVYFEAVADYGTIDIEAAVRAFLSGSAPGVNLNFAPPAPAFAAEVRRQMTLRLDAEARARRPQLPPPDIVHTPESQARVKERADALVAQLGELTRTDDAKAAARARLMATNERFDAERGYSIGAQDGEGNAG